MATLHLLGTGSSSSDPHRTTTMLAFADEGSVLVVDCGGDVGQRLLACGLKLDDVRALLLTHEHPDHTAGFALFVQRLWLAGRREALPVYGNKEALEQARRNFEVYDTSGWPDMPPLVWHEIAFEENARVLEDEHWQVTASPGEHPVPTVGLKVVSRKSGKAVCYSADTAPSRAIARLARGCELLVHEATGEGPGHSSAMDAARIASEAEVKALWLVHLPPEAKLDEAAMQEARKVFCETRKADEGGSYTF